MSFVLIQYLERQAEWSQKTFGPGRRTKGIIAHIKKELIEIEQEPKSLEEWIDVVILTLDGAWRAGYSPKQIVNALWCKQDMNIERDWPAPGPEDQPIEHIRGDP